MDKSSEKLFLEKMIETKTPVSIYLKNGIRLIGIILSMDSDSLLLASEKFSDYQLVLKHNIATIFPHMANTTEKA